MHTCLTVTCEEMPNSPDDCTAKVTQLTDDFPAPLQRNEGVLHPVPMPCGYKFDYRGGTSGDRRGGHAG